jgi:alginate O-acetyltransferase complex protein AlgI
MGKRSPYGRLPRAGRIAATFVLVLFSWVLFRSPSLGRAVAYFGAMFGAVPSSAASALLAGEIYTPTTLLVMAVCAAISFQPVEVCDWVESLTWRRAAALVPLFLFAIGVMFTQAFNPFLYFQF